MYTQEQICCLFLKAQSCVGQIGYEIVLKANKGYCVEALENKLKYAICLKDMIGSKISNGTKTVKDNIIDFCGTKIFLSKNNSLFLTNIDSNSCSEELELSEECCIDLCEVESKLNEICKNC